MARITIEDCLDNIENRFAIVLVAAKRVRQLERGAKPLVQSKNKSIVTSPREIAAGKVRIKQGTLNSNSKNKPTSNRKAYNKSDFVPASAMDQM